MRHGHHGRALIEVIQLNTRTRNRGSVPGPDQDYREIRVKIRAGHPLFSEIAALKHADAADLLSTLILEGLTWQRRVGPVLEMLSKGVQPALPMSQFGSQQSGGQEVSTAPSETIRLGISGEDVLESFGISR